MVRSLTAKTRNAAAFHRKWVQVLPNHLLDVILSPARIPYAMTQAVGTAFYACCGVNPYRQDKGPWFSSFSTAAQWGGFYALRSSVGQSAYEE